MGLAGFDQESERRRNGLPDQDSAEVQPRPAADVHARAGAAAVHRIAEEAGTGTGGVGQEKKEEKDPNVIELKTKVSKLVNDRYGGDYKKAFDHYDTSHDGGVNKDELVQLLKDAGVGNALTRGTWASRIIERMDTNHDGKIQWSEFESGIKG